MSTRTRQSARWLRATRWLGRLIFRTRNLLFPLVVLPVGLLSRPRLCLGSRRADLVLDLVGLFIAFAGEALRYAVIGLEYIERGGRAGRIHASSLVSGGLFAYSRNPLYLGNLLMILGLALVHGGVGMYAIVLPFFLLAYSSIVAAEEEYLGARFGAEYQAYRLRVPRFWPRLSGLWTTMRSMRFDWRRVVRKEHATSFYLATSALAALGWERVAADGFRAHRVLLEALGWTWGGVLLVFLWARYLKKSGALSRPASSAPPRPQGSMSRELS